MNRAEISLRSRRNAANKIRKSIRVGFIVGVPLFLYGGYSLLFQQVDVGVNIRVLQPVVINGALPLILGSGLIIGSIWSLKNKHRLVDDEVKSMVVKKKLFKHMR